jgi:hypothetical protein
MKNNQFPDFDNFNPLSNTTIYIMRFDVKFNYTGNFIINLPILSSYTPLSDPDFTFKTVLI